MQELYFTHPCTMLNVNSIYNSDYTGSPLWNLFCHESRMIENSYNVSVRTMLDIPLNTHRYLIEPLTGVPHVKQSLIKRFLKFCENLKNSKKSVVRNVYNMIKFDTRHTIGSNLREIALLSDKTVSELITSDHKHVQYIQIPDMEEYRLDMIWEIIDIKQDQMKLENLDKNELNLILTHLCSS